MKACVFFEEQGLEGKVLSDVQGGVCFVLPTVHLMQNVNLQQTAAQCLGIYCLKFILLTDLWELSNGAYNKTTTIWILNCMLPTRNLTDKTASQDESEEHAKGNQK